MGATLCLMTKKTREKRRQSTYKHNGTLPFVALSLVALAGPRPSYYRRMSVTLAENWWTPPLRYIILFFINLLIMIACKPSCVNCFWIFVETRYFLKQHNGVPVNTFKINCSQFRLWRLVDANLHYWTFFGVKKSLKINLFLSIR